MELVKTDIYLDVLAEDYIRVQPRSVHGMLWLQLHFPDDAWYNLQLGSIGITQEDAVSLSQDAELCGLRVLFP